MIAFRELDGPERCRPIHSAATIMTRRTRKARRPRNRLIHKALACAIAPTRQVLPGLQTEESTPGRGRRSGGWRFLEYRDHCAAADAGVLPSLLWEFPIGFTVWISIQQSANCDQDFSGAAGGRNRQCLERQAHGGLNRARTAVLLRLLIGEARESSRPDA
jgi:hypothetical protein